MFTLYQLLPHYVSSGTLEFRPLLSRSVIQGFEITNPSNAKLIYEGHHHRKRQFQVREQDNNSFTSSNCKLHDWIICKIAYSRAGPLTSKTPLSLSMRNMATSRAPILATTIVVDLSAEIDPTSPLYIYWWTNVVGKLIICNA